MSRLPRALFLLRPFRCAVLLFACVASGGRRHRRFLGVARSLPAVADLRVLRTVEYAVAVAAAVVCRCCVAVLVVVVLLACPP